MPISKLPFSKSSVRVRALMARFCHDKQTDSNERMPQLALLKTTLESTPFIA
jgi:hypothetical protein